MHWLGVCVWIQCSCITAQWVSQTAVSAVPYRNSTHVCGVEEKVHAVCFTSPAPALLKKPVLHRSLLRYTTNTHSHTRFTQPLYTRRLKEFRHRKRKRCSFLKTYSTCIQSICFFSRSDSCCNPLPRLTPQTKHPFSVEARNIPEALKIIAIRLDVNGNAPMIINFLSDWGGSHGSWLRCEAPWQSFSWVSVTEKSTLTAAFD